MSASIFKQYANLDREILASLSRYVNVEVDTYLFLKSMTHVSFCYDHSLDINESYEKLELLGDAVLYLLVTEIIIDRHSELHEGQISVFRSAIISEKYLSYVALKLELNKLVKLGKNEIKNKINFSQSILCDLLESLLGAIYQVYGTKECCKFINKYLIQNIENYQKEFSFFNYKTIIQEILQREKRQNLVYKVKLDKKNENHIVCTYLDGVKKCTMVASTRKEAEQKSARYILEKEYSNLLDENFFVSLFQKKHKKYTIKK